MLVRIEEYYDGFAIIVDDGIKEQRFGFDQEDDKRGLLDVFEVIGIEAEYEEAY